MNPALDFKHEFVRGRAERTLLLLHGTGGNEHDLLPLGRELDPNASLLSPRGKVLENGMPRFFHRLAEGVFDEEDVKLRASELAYFVAAAANQYGFDQSKLVAVGFSNGANIAAAILLLHGAIFQTAVLFRPMVPLVPDALPDLRQVRILQASGDRDPIVSIDESKRLAALFRKADAVVDLTFASAGHGLAASEVDETKHWLT